jgi:hypothetical protein
MREDIIRMAREAGLSNDFGHFGYPYLPELERFAALVAARCAEIAYEAEPWHSADLIHEAFGVKKWLNP